MDKEGINHPIGIKEKIKNKNFNEISHFEGINQFRDSLSKLNDLSSVLSLKNRITKRILATNERLLHNEMFRVMIDYSEIQEIEQCKSPFLPDYI